jgi:hypothetical protein
MSDFKNSSLISSFQEAVYRHKKTKDRVIKALFAMFGVSFFLGFFPYSVIKESQMTISFISGMAFYSAGYLYGKAHYSIAIEELKEKLDYIERNKKG